MPKSKAREFLIKLQCAVCEKAGRKQLNYYTRKNKKTTEKKLTVKKHCARCRKHTDHKEAKK